MKVYPNPMYGGAFTLRLPVAVQKEVHVAIVDGTGRTVFTKKLNDPHQPFDASTLPAGFYVVRATSDGAVFHSALIVQ